MAIFSHELAPPTFKQNSPIMQTEIQEVYGYKKRIQDATGAPIPVLPILERIMRDEIFHSTLDWQTTRQFNAAARKALRIYQKHQVFHDLEHLWHAARWKLACADAELAKAQQSGSEAEIIKAQNAQKKADTAHTHAYNNMARYF